MRSLRFITVSAAALFLLASCGREEPEAGGRFQTPQGFVVESVLPETNTDSLIQLTFDSFGRPVVSKERGHPTLLLDNDGDGIFESEKIFSDKVQHAQGLWFEGRTLYVVGNDVPIGNNAAKPQAGLYKLEDSNGDDQADTFEMLHPFTGPMGEHGPHDIRRSPDGSISVLVGNHTFVPQEMIEPLSPMAGYRESQLLDRYTDARGHASGIMAPGGAILGLDREAMKYTLLVGGFRNPYNHAYNWEGELFTFDSDMEWDINLPWYREVRSVHAVPGGDYGWRTGSGKFPAYYLDSLPPMSDLGRGSPVGVDFYQHHAYPPEYLGVFFQADWSRGRIVMSKTARDGATYKTTEDPADFVYGEPLNVTDAKVGPDGFLYFTMGGRDTRGGLYRVAYRGRQANDGWKQVDGVMAALRQPQPLSSWGYAALAQRKEKMGAQWGSELERVARDGRAQAPDRVQALFLLQMFGPKPNADLLEALRQDRDASVRAAAIYVVGQHGSDRAKAVAARGLKDADAFVRRRAAEALVRMGLTASAPSFAPVGDIYALLNDSDRFVRYAGRLALERTPRVDWKDRVLAETNPLGAIEGQVALVRTAASEAEIGPVLQAQLGWLKRGDLSPENTLRLLRAFHLACIELKAGCPPALRKQVSDLLLPRFPAADDRLTTEYARTLAYLGQPEAIGKILAAMPKGDEKQPLQIHYVYCLRTIRQGWTPEQKRTLVSWFQQARHWRGGGSFPGFILLLFDSSLEFFNEQEKQMAYQAIPDFAPATSATAAKSSYERANELARKGVRGVSQEEIFEFMLYDPMTTRATAERGREVYEAECSKCHRFGDLGKDYGPDLTTIANRFNRRDMVEAVLWPSKTISDQYQSYIIHTANNELHNGLILSEDSEKILFMLPDQDRPLEIRKSDIRSRRVSDISTMPEDLLDGYSMGQIADLFALLESGAASGAASGSQK